MKTANLTGAALDWAVAKCEGALSPLGNVVIANGALTITIGGRLEEPTVNFAPSADWAQGGPIIDLEGIGFFQKKDEGYCQAAMPGAEFVRRGPTPLVAAMRCYVASKLGEEIEIPLELLA